MLVSIIMPVKNTKAYLQDCIESLLRQSYTDWELIAVDDHSTDNSYEILQNFADKDNRIKVYTSDGNGIIAALQTGYNYCVGEVIHRMDSDDIMPPNKLGILLGALKQGSVVTGKVKYFSTEGEIGDGFKSYEYWLNEVWKSGKGWNDIYRECPIASPAWLILRADFERIGGFESDAMPEDYDLAFRMCKHNLKVHFCDEVVHLWRDSSGRTSRNESQYFPLAYYPLKVKRFLDIDYDDSKSLVLIGAGKKGKLIARLLLEKEVKFEWMTNNVKKQNVPIYDVQLKDTKWLKIENTQVIIALSGPKDRVEISNFLGDSSLENDCYWFC